MTGTPPISQGVAPSLDRHETAVEFTEPPPSYDVTNDLPPADRPLPSRTHFPLPEIADNLDLPDVHFRHASWARHRTSILRALQLANVPQLRLFRFAACGSLAWVMTRQDDPSKLRIAASYCRDRFCLPCQTERARNLATVLHRQIPATPLLFITLTVRHSPDPLSAQLTRLIASFRRLRQRRLWLDNVTGGVAFLEVKRSKDGRFWHPHLHLIAQARYLSQSRLAEAWHAITTDSYIVDVRRVRDHARVRSYVTKYAAKPMSYAATNDPDLLAEAIAALAGRRLCFTFGSWRSFRLTEKLEPYTWQPLCRLSDLLHRVQLGDSHAAELLAQLRSNLPCTRRDKLKSASTPPTHKPTC